MGIITLSIALSRPLERIQLLLNFSLDFLFYLYGHCDGLWCPVK